MRSRHICIIVTLVLGMTGAVRADEEYDELKARLVGTMMVFYAEQDVYAERAGWTRRSLPPTPKQSQAMQAMQGARGLRDTPRRDFRDEFLRYAEKHAGKPEAAEAWAYAMTMSRCVASDNGYIETPETATALQHLVDEHTGGPEIESAMDVVRQDGHCLRFETLTRFYESIEAKNKNPELIARARYHRAMMHRNPIQYRGMTRFWIDKARARSEEVLAEERIGNELLQSVIKDFPETKWAESAESILFDESKLAVGTKLPDFEGKDIDGKTIRLADYRGRVVMVVFWASWCGPCMDRVPEERELAAKFKDKPFTIIGINNDRTREAFVKVMQKEKLTWPVIFDGDPNKGPIATSLHIDRYPTVLLLDCEGHIRDKRLYGEQLEKAIEELIAKVPKSGKPEKSATSQPAA